MDGHRTMDPRRIDVTDGNHLSVLDYGKGGLPLLLLHGIPGRASVWDKVIDRLPDGYRVIVPDLLGFGASSRPNGALDLHAENQANTLAVALDQLDIASVMVVGHDFGGPVALWLTRLRPGLVTHLGLVATNVMPDTPIPQPLNLLTAPVVGGLVERMMMSPSALRMMANRGVGRPKIAIDGRAYVGDRRQARAIRTIFSTSLRNLRDLYTPTKEALDALTIPVFVAWGEIDPFFPVAEGRRIADAVAGSTFTVFNGAGHFLPDERPDRLVELIVKSDLGMSG
jgi:pimeloyl-ACP methyl ester carboxylesterase